MHRIATNKIITRFKADPIVAKVLVFTLCSAVAVHLADALNDVTIRGFYPEVLRAAFGVLRIPFLSEHLESEFKKLQHGCIDLLGLLLAVDASDQSTGSKIQLLDDADAGAPGCGPPRPVSEVLLAELVAGGRGGEGERDRDSGASGGASGGGDGGSSAQLQICIANAIIAAVSHVQRFPGIPAKRLEVLYRLYIGQFLRAAATPTGPVRLRAACVQSIFSYCYHLRDTGAVAADVDELTQLCVGILEEPVEGRAVLRTACLKLVGAMLSTQAATGGAQMPGAGALKLAALLAGVAHIDPCEETQRLAAQLSDALQAGSRSR